MGSSCGWRHYPNGERSLCGCRSSSAVVQWTTWFVLHRDGWARRVISVAKALIIIPSSWPWKFCLNGRETNLKSRQSLPVTAKLLDNNAAFQAFRAEIVCEPPNNNLSRFEGTLKIDGLLQRKDIICTVCQYSLVGLDCLLQRMWLPWVINKSCCVDVYYGILSGVMEWYCLPERTPNWCRTVARPNWSELALIVCSIMSSSGCVLSPNVWFTLCNILLTQSLS